MTDETFSASEIETRAKLAGLSVAQMCAQAGVAHSTFTRWRAGHTEPTLTVYRRLVQATRLGVQTGDAA